MCLKTQCKTFLRQPRVLHSRFGGSRPEERVGKTSLASFREARPFYAWQRALIIIYLRPGQKKKHREKKYLDHLFERGSPHRTRDSLLVRLSRASCCRSLSKRTWRWLFTERPKNDRLESLVSSSVTEDFESSGQAHMSNARTVLESRQTLVLTFPPGNFIVNNHYFDFFFCRLSCS